MDAVLISVFGYLLHLKCISGSEIYPSIHWFPQNPILVADGASCGPGPRQLKVQLQSKVNFICPNTATVLQKSLVGIQPADMYENLWLLYNKTAFDKCDASLDPTRRLLLSCNTPMQLKFFPVLFAQFTAEPNGLIFEGGRSYYFIATSDGTESHLSDLSEGHCEDTSNNVYMKIEVYVCKRSNQTYQDPECTRGVGELDCPNVTVVTPSSSIATTTVTSTAATSEEISIIGSMRAPTSVTASGDVCGQTVITKTISPEVISTKPMSCADVCSKTIFSTVTVSSTVLPTTARASEMVSAKTVSSEVMFTKPLSCADICNKTVFSTVTVSSSVVPTKTVQASDIIATKTVSASSVTPTKTLQASDGESSDSTSAAAVPSKPMVPAVLSTKNVSFAVVLTKTVYSAVTSTVGCKRCISLSAQTTVSSIPPKNENESQAAKQEQLADGQVGANNKETWMYVAIFFLVFFGIVIVIGFAVYMKYRKKICHRYTRRVAPQEERSGQYNPAGSNAEHAVWDG